MPARPTLRDIARTTGFSLATVSAALNNDARVRGSTRALVRAAAAAAGYSPDPALRALSYYRWNGRRSQQGMTLVYVSGWPKTLPTHSSHVVMMEAMRRRAEELGYRFYPYRLHELGSLDRAHHILASRGTSGLLVGPIMEEAQLAGFDLNSFPAVAVDLGHFRPSLPLVSSNPIACLQVVLPRVLASGRRRIGVVLPTDSQSEFFNVQRAWFLKFQRALARGIARLPQHDYSDPARLEQWIQRNRPDAIIGWSECLLSVFKQLKFRVPEDAAFVTLRKDFKEYPDVPLRPEVAGMVQSSAQIGRVAVDQVDSLIRRNEKGDSVPKISIYVTLQWHGGATLPCGLN